ncbi:MAG: pyrroloquinoline-quinone synthase PqqC [Proteobacteria bacterium]|nr:pyrroloquinoline-quinone synthase PqqC [Pseudomonadota bacterium]
MGRNGDCPVSAPQPADGAAVRPWSREQFEAQLRERGRAYHIHHPFNIMLNSGRASREQVRGWVANRYYYQINIPIKDAAILANCEDRAVRRNWVQRILDHDGHGEDPGGIESWLRLADAVGLARAQVQSLEMVLPGVRFAVDAYVNFARRAPWPESVCASLTELFAPEIHRQRLAGWPQHYPWIEPQGLHYFQSRVSLARRDVEFGLAVTLERFGTRAQQERALAILQFKLDILWQMNDAMAQAYGVSA